MYIAEEFLHFIWKFRLYQAARITSTIGQSIEVLQPGWHNTDAGPDFSKAKILLQGMLWVGQVEIHVKASEWVQHNHHLDDAYENVILHVVYEDDQPVYRKDGTLVPTLVLAGLFDQHLFSEYDQLIRSFNNFPCEKQIGLLDPLYINSFLSRTLVERFEQKSKEVNRLLSRNRNDWDETFYVLLAKNFGFKVNALPFEMLAFSLGRQILAKYQDQPKCIEALIFGQAGFLEQDFAAGYPLALKAEYQFLRKKHNLQPINVSLWKFLRMRPQNFPTIRLAQFAALMLKSSRLFSTILEAQDPGSLMALFETLPVNPYWEKHYHFNKESSRVVLQLGGASVRNILINTVCQTLFAYGKYTGSQMYADHAIALLENLEAEKNSIVGLYTACGLKIETAYLSQAILQLNKNYCIEKKCLNCSIGIKILNK